MTTEDKIKTLEAENEKLRDRFQKQKAKTSKRRKLGWRFLKRSSGLVLGIKLKLSIEKFLNELGDDRRVSKNTLSDLLSAIILRLTRIGFLLVITALLPSILLIFQTYYLARQTTLINDQKELFQKQNTRLDQQTYLQEAERRSSVIVLLDNVIKDVNTELSTSGSRVSKATTGRLIALSKMLKPYRYLQNDSLTERVVSPERGYLLLSLIESDLSFRLSSNSGVNGSLLERLDFSYAELPNVSIINEDLLGINLSQADLEYANLSGTDFKNANFSNATLENATLKLANLEGANLFKANLRGVNFDNADLRKTNLRQADLREATFKDAKLIGSTFTNARVTENFQQRLQNQVNKETFNWFTKTYTVVEVDKTIFQLLEH